MKVDENTLVLGLNSQLYLIGVLFNMDLKKKKWKIIDLKGIRLQVSKLVRLNINTSLSYEKILHENFPYVFDLNPDILLESIAKSTQGTHPIELSINISKIKTYKGTYIYI